MKHYHVFPSLAEGMLYKHGFVLVLDGSSGYAYIECKECMGTNQVNRTQHHKDRTKVIHLKTCKLASLLRGALYEQ